MKRIPFLIIGLIVIASITMAAEPFWSTKVMLGLRGQIGKAGRFITFSFENDQSPSDGQVATWNTGDTVTWETVAGSGDVSKVGTPVDNQVGVWTGDGTMEGTSDLTFDGISLITSGSFLNSTGTHAFGGVGGTNNENLTWNFETFANAVEVSSTTGVALIRLAVDLRLNDNNDLRFGSGDDVQMRFQQSGGNDAFHFGLDVGSADSSGYYSIMELADIANANRSPLATTAYPILRLYGPDETEALHYGEFGYDGSNFVFGVGSGGFLFGGVAIDESDVITGATIDADNNTITNIGLDELTANFEATQQFFNGSFDKEFNATISEAGGVVTMSIEQSGGGDLVARFSDGYTAYDTSPADTIALTVGTDSSPQTNWIYILKTAPTTLVKEITNGWPAAEHLKIGFFFCQSAAIVNTAGGTLINQNWNDGATDENNQGEITHITEKLRLLGASYFSGVDGNGTDNYLTPTASNVEFISTAGIVYQMHSHSFVAVDTSGTDVLHVKNWSGDSFHALTNLFDIVDDSTGATITANKYFNLVFWGVANQEGEHQTVLINLPSGSYNTQSAAEQDTQGFDDFSIPREFSLDSPTGFLIARMTIQMATTWVVASTVDLRGASPQTASGGAASAITMFADNTFDVFNNTDNTKVMKFDVGSVTTGNTRTYIAPDEDGTLTLDAGTSALTNKTINADNNTVSNIGSAEITNDSIVDEDINSAAAIAGSKIVDATTSVEGSTEHATTAEIDAGADSGRSITPGQFEDSDYGKRIVSLLLNDSTNLTTGDGKIFFRLPDALAGWSITGVSAARSVGNGTDTYMLRNVTQGQDVLSTILTLDAGELDSNTAAVPAVIDTGQDDGTLYDRYAIDVDSVGTDTVYAEFQIEFQRIP